MIKMPEQEKEWSKKRGATLIEDLDILLGDLCIIWGFCNGLTGWELAHNGDAITADHFLYWRLFNEVKHSIISLTAARSFNDGRTRNIRHADRATTVTTYLSRFMEWLP